MDVCGRLNARLAAAELAATAKLGVAAKLAAGAIVKAGATNRIDLIEEDNAPAQSGSNSESVISR